MLYYTMFVACVCRARAAEELAPSRAKHHAQNTAARSRRRRLLALGAALGAALSIAAAAAVLVLAVLLEHVDCNACAPRARARRLAR